MSRAEPAVPHEFVHQRQRGHTFVYLFGNPTAAAPCKEMSWSCTTRAMTTRRVGKAGERLANRGRPMGTALLIPRGETVPSRATGVVLTVFAHVDLLVTVGARAHVALGVHGTVAQGTGGAAAGTASEQASLNRRACWRVKRQEKVGGRSLSSPSSTSWATRTTRSSPDAYPSARRPTLNSTVGSSGNSVMVSGSSSAC